MNKHHLRYHDAVDINILLCVRRGRYKFTHFKYWRKKKNILLWWWLCEPETTVPFALLKIGHSDRPHLYSSSPEIDDKRGRSCAGEDEDGFRFYPSLYHMRKI